MSDKANKKKEYTFEEQLLSITTIIDSVYNIKGKPFLGQATGFYYTEVSPAEEDKKGPQWVKLEKFWLVTNRHAILHKDESGCEHLPEKFEFRMRRDNQGQIEWVPIALSKEEMKSILKVHRNAAIDVAVIDVSSFIQKSIQDERTMKDGGRLLIPATLTNANLPNNQPFTIDVTSDIVVASYPKGFYDEHNKFPIVKSGIIASGWGFSFNNQQMFQIDAQLFPGSSGGLVISKPTNIAMFDGTIHKSEIKQFAFLGVYSGEYKWREKALVGGMEITVTQSYGLGNVWYSFLVPEIISDGIKIGC